MRTIWQSAQTYLDLYSRYRDPAMIAPIKERMDAVMQLPDDPHKPLWWWCDALFMAPPVLAKLSKATGERKYLDFMDHEWWITSDLLYSPKDSLFFRDRSYFNAHEANGSSVFWSRGNGWVFAGLARVLADMPADYPSRPRYVAQFQQMAQKIASLQGADGLWRAGLLDEADYKLPEISGSAFFTYGFAYGINSGILDGKIYKPVVQRAWQGLDHPHLSGRQIGQHAACGRCARSIYSNLQLCLRRWWILAGRLRSLPSGSLMRQSNMSRVVIYRLSHKHRSATTGM